MNKLDEQSLNYATTIEEIIQSLGLLFTGAVFLRSAEFAIIQAAEKALREAREREDKMKEDEAKTLKAFCDVLNKKKEKVTTLEQQLEEEREKNRAQEEVIKELRSMSDRNHQLAKLRKMRLKPTQRKYWR